MNKIDQIQNFKNTEPSSIDMEKNKMQSKLETQARIASILLGMNINPITNNDMWKDLYDQIMQNQQLYF